MVLLADAHRCRRPLATACLPAAAALTSLPLRLSPRRFAAAARMAAPPPRPVGLRRRLCERLVRGRVATVASSDECGRFTPGVPPPWPVCRGDERVHLRRRRLGRRAIPVLDGEARNATPSLQSNKSFFGSYASLETNKSFFGRTLPFPSNGRAGSVIACRGRIGRIGFLDAALTRFATVVVPVSDRDERLHRNRNRA